MSAETENDARRKELVQRMAAAVAASDELLKEIDAADDSTIEELRTSPAMTRCGRIHRELFAWLKTKKKELDAETQRIKMSPGESRGGELDPGKPTTPGIVPQIDTPANLSQEIQQ